MSKLRSDELVNMEGDGAPSFPQSATTIEPTADNQVATKSYVDLALSAASGNAVSATPPANPALGSFWTDTSVSPSILKTWNGNTWIEFAGEGTPYTGFLGSPVEVLTPLDGAGVGGAYNYTARTDTISNVDTQFEYGFVTKADLNMTSSSFRMSHVLYENGRYVALGFNDGIRYSDDGMTWNTATHPQGRWYGMTYNGSRFIVVGDENNNKAMYSDDGIAWQSSNTHLSGNWTAVAADPATGRVVASGYNAPSSQSQFMYSDNGGETWQYCNSSGQYRQRRPDHIAFGNGIWVSPAHGGSDSYKSYAEYSTDGINWNVASNSNDNYYPQGLVFVPETNTFVALLNQWNSANQTHIGMTTNGSTWTYINNIGTNSNDAYSNRDAPCFAYYNGVYYYATQSAGFRWSTDLTNWNRSYFANSSSSTGGLVTVANNKLIMAANSNAGLNFYKAKPNSSPPIQGHGSNKVESKTYTFASNNVFDKDTGNIVPNADFVETFDRLLTFTSNNSYNFYTDSITDGQIVTVGTSQSTSAGDSFYTYSQLTAYGPSPSDIVFTSQNANTTPVSATDATVAFRKWTLETRASSSDPWTVVITSDDYDIAASQDGATPWSASPTLQPNTSYRVKVSYHSANAETIESNYNTFETGPS
tara:strand:+ start:1453 stop:3390 length:1938 start_codon:yes stop_codon:yes gene_type:complete